MRRFKDASALMACIGEDIGYSDWVEVDQAMINQFADATHDQQWIHVDPEGRRPARLVRRLRMAF